ncbi:TetR/AcrR family transcriptional regulator [Corynebacterium phoceense]|uniref:TetR/AcrR family transcriptional regulator n=1 Tax=Corynebacterium phoceense TaxID=1686286 RepID=UPI00211CB41D|nr:TetR/AcrR family transcriptional regulator [Corynebacterium phoceense]MCQ9332695.1 TetR/AcrR family transcriptional regulator [Corynebacterium phoceense]
MRADALRRRNALIDAAIELFRTQGPEVTLDRVAERAGVGIATLYRNFADKDALAIACIERMGIAFLERQQDINHRLEDADAAAAQALVHDYAQALLDIGAATLIPVFIPERLSALDPTLLHELEKLIAGGDFFIARGQAAGAIGPGVTHLEFVTGLLAITRPRTVDLAEYQPDIEARMVDLYLAGVRAGHQE